MIKISYPKKFYLFLFPKFTFAVGRLDANNSKFVHDIEENLIYNNKLYLINFSKFRFEKLNFEKHSFKKPTNKLKYPIVLPIQTLPEFGIPIDINRTPFSLKKILSTKIIQSPIDLNFINNIKICQTQLNHQIQTCPVLNQ